MNVGIFKFNFIKIKYVVFNINKNALLVKTKMALLV